MRQVNLLPEELQKAQSLKIIGSSLLFNIGAVVIFVVLINSLLSFWITNLETVALQPLALKENNEITQIRAKISEIEKETGMIFKKNRDIMEVFARNSSFSHLLKVIGNVTSDKVWLTSLTFVMKDRRCKMDGLSFNTRLVSEFMLELKKISYFKNVELLSMEKEGRGIKEVAFTIECELK